MKAEGKRALWCLGSITVGAIMWLKAKIMMVATGLSARHLGPEVLGQEWLLGLSSGCPNSGGSSLHQETWENLCVGWRRNWHQPEPLPSIRRSFLNKSGTIRHCASRWINSLYPNPRASILGYQLTASGETYYSSGCVSPQHNLQLSSQPSLVPMQLLGNGASTTNVPLGPAGLL